MLVGNYINLTLPTFGEYHIGCIGAIDVEKLGKNKTIIMINLLKLICSVFHYQKKEKKESKCNHIPGKPEKECIVTSMMDDGCGIHETWGLRMVVRCTKCNKILQSE